MIALLGGGADVIREERDRADGKMTSCDEGWTDDFVVTYPKQQQILPVEVSHRSTLDPS
jgi:hypothetical protein